MHGFPSDFTVEGLVGSDLQQICIGKYDVQFRFSSGTFIAVQGGARILKNETQVSLWTEEGSWDTLAFHELLNHSVIRYVVTSKDVLQIDFDNGLILELIDDSDQYESMQIYPNGKLNSIIVI
jgi:hypothetical protein